jgi:hypothetical protein
LEYTDFLKEVAKVKSPEAQMLPGKIKQLGLAPFQTIQLSPDVKTPMVENDIMDESTAVPSPQPHISHAFNHTNMNNQPYSGRPVSFQQKASPPTSIQPYFNTNIHRQNIIDRPIKQ